MSIGAQARFIVGGDISGINKLSVASGKTNNAYTHIEMNSLSGTTGNDTITFGKFSDTAIRGEVDLRDAAKQDKITAANDACLGIAGDIINYDVLSIKLGSNSKLGLNENMYQLYKDNVLDITEGKGAKVYNLGTAQQAEAFRGFMEELTDNSDLDKFSKLGDNDNGWLSNAADNDYKDTCDYVALDAINFSSCTIHSESGKIKVTIFKKDETNQWGDSGTAIEEGTGSSTGTWLIEGLEDYTSDTCRIQVELNDNVEGIYTYQITLA